jgi:hypothetical protein
VRLAAPQLGVQAGGGLGHEAEQRVQGIALSPGRIGALSSRRIGADVGRVEVERDPIAALHPEQAEGRQVHRAQRLVELADVPQGEAPEKRPRGLWSGYDEAAKPLLRLIRARHGKVVETGRSQRDGLAHGENRLGLGEPTSALLEMEV